MAEDEAFAPARRRSMRRGFTTGSCAAAAAKAAALALTTGRPVEAVSITLPIGETATFTLARHDLADGEAFCAIVKDAGDDPDVTHGAEICARVGYGDGPGVRLSGGPGVGVVTRPGLGLEVGGPAINPVPRQMIHQAVREAAGDVVATRGLRVEISVPRGEDLARKTLNPRLGILGGISILGTTGIVEPYSTAAWRASVEQAIDVAAANGQRRLILATGGRSEKFAMRHFSLPEIAFVEMGIFTGHALRRCQRHPITWVALCGMIGKLSKIAQGHFQTHVAGNQVDPRFLAEVALAAGVDSETARRLGAANTARHVQELVREAGSVSFFDALCQRTRAACLDYVKSAFAIQVVMFDFDGSVLGTAGDA